MPVSSALAYTVATTSLQPNRTLKQNQLFLLKVMEDEVVGLAFLLLLI
jgi:hypothetical protein